MPCDVCGYPKTVGKVRESFVSSSEEYEVCEYCYSYKTAYGHLPHGRKMEEVEG